MKVIVLGSAAGGGFPQWNCGCLRCEGVRKGSIDAKPRTQSSIAISADDEHWMLINASPDLRQQLINNPTLWPKETRHSPLCGVMLTDAQMDHVTGLLMLREGFPLKLHCTPTVHKELTQTLPLLPTLKHWNGGFEHEALPENVKSAFTLDSMPQLEWRCIPITSNAPPYSPRRNTPSKGDNIAIFVFDKKTKRSLLYAPGLGKITPIIAHYMEKASCLMLDGTCWTNEEMECVGSKKTALQMGHMPQTGENGLLEHIDAYTGKRKILIHINNTNPILDENSEARDILNQKEVEVAYDGMMVEL